LDLGRAKVVVGSKVFNRVVNLKDYQFNIDQMKKALTDVENVRFSKKTVQTIKGS